MRVDRRDFFKMAVFNVCFTALRCNSASNLTSAGKPNIVLCMADDQGWGDMAYNGHPVLKTPNFDAMSASATGFYRPRPVIRPGCLGPGSMVPGVIECH